MRAFASGTSVPVARSRVEIETLLGRHGASHVGVMLAPGKAEVLFTIGDWSVRFQMPLPSADEARFTHRDRWTPRAEAAAQRLWEQACRTKWRCLLLTIKAKLVSVENQVETFEEAFLAHIVSQDGSTVAQRVLPKMREERKMLAAGDGQ